MRVFGSVSLLAFAACAGAPRPLTRSVYVDPAANDDERRIASALVEEAAREVDAFFDAKTAAAEVVLCTTEACALAHAGPERRACAFLGPPAKIVVLGIGPLTKGTLVHEMIHVEIARRGNTSLPAWFEEGVATFIGDNAWCPPGTMPALDDLRRLDRQWAWAGFTKDLARRDPAYCQARDEIAAWTKRHDRRALVRIVDDVARGKSFDDVYGALLTAPPREAWSRRRVARFSAEMVTGPFASLGVPDSPFSIALRVLPRANEKVLVHTAVDDSGGAGYCLPLLGFDANGGLAAQIATDADPKSIVSAVAASPPLDRWSRIVVTWSDRDGLRLYVDGTLVASAAARHRLAPGGPLRVFFGSDCGAQCWPGAIVSGGSNATMEDVELWDYALGADEVRAMSRE